MEGEDRLPDLPKFSLSAPPSGLIRFLLMIAIDLWNRLPTVLQFALSRFYSYLFKLSFSRLFIFPFCKMNSLDREYLKQFRPAGEKRSYQSFQDFFTRRLVTPLKTEAYSVWPCEGYVCQQGQIEDLTAITVKGQWRNLQTIFDPSKQSLVPGHYHFSNVFLHNHNYHRIHAPVSGKITRIQQVSGKLSFLRPWFYGRFEVSKPALFNERFNIDIRDHFDRTWFLSIVGGMGVGTIQILNQLKVGSMLRAGDELALFRLGSTCCIASPDEPKKKYYMETVVAGEPLTNQFHRSMDVPIHEMNSALDL